MTKAEPKSGGYPALAPLAKTLAATGMLLGVVLAGLQATGRADVSSLFQRDETLTGAQIQERVAAFDAMGEVSLEAVQDKDVPQAVESMQLPAAEKETLLNDLKEQPSAPSNAQAPGGSTSPAPAKEAAPQRERRRLVWISLWDVNIDGGDVVRIDSQGYSRTVTLQKTPIVFAVPTSDDGHWVIRVTGVGDIGGKGINVGLSSGAYKVVLPLFHTKPNIGLKVQVD